MQETQWPPENVGRGLRRLRRKKKLSQRELARKIGAGSQAMVSLWELGRAKPSGKTVLKLLEVLGATRQDLRLAVDEPEEPGRALPSSPVSREIGTLLAAWRTRLGLAQSVLAERAGIDPALFRRIERGRAGLKIDTLVQILAAVGVDLLGVLEETMRSSDSEPGSPALDAKEAGCIIRLLTRQVQTLERELAEARRGLHES